jgi:putative FmdB family regulatory protein
MEAGFPRFPSTMPIYAFACAACGHHFDKLQKLSDPDPAACPECGAPAVERQVTAPSFRLSGSGWYETDFKKDGDRKRNLAGDGASAGNGAKADAKPADTKPAEAKSGEKPAASKAEAVPAAAKPVASGS